MKPGFALKTWITRENADQDSVFCVFGATFCRIIAPGHKDSWILNPGLRNVHEDYTFTRMLNPGFTFLVHGFAFSAIYSENISKKQKTVQIIVIFSQKLEKLKPGLLELTPGLLQDYSRISFVWQKVAARTILANPARIFE
ncbi:MAG: hypothetical protein VX772_07365 [Bacteroidota bacterium]|nr:hypothetical protein [Bacteroidota bacterium]